MRVLGILRVRNGVGRVERTLDNLACLCDAVYALDDRSTDRTRDVLLHHPLVANVFTADTGLSQRPWFFPESTGLELLYRMADFYLPDWVIAADDDVAFEPEANVRQVLEEAAEDVVGFEMRCVSTWNDPAYPEMVPLMGAATSWQVRAWRYRPNLHPGEKPLHNGYGPANLEGGRLARTDAVRCIHSGWDTLARRIEKVDLYSALDPGGRLNFGVRYDEGLLFGFRRDAVDELIAEYRARLNRVPKRTRRTS